MKTEQEQIKAIKQIIDERVETTLGQVQGRHGNVIKTVDTVIIARDIVNAGYGDVSEYKAEIKRLKSNTPQHIKDLLIEFDEMGFAPTTVCPNPDKYATEWRDSLVNCVNNATKQAQIDILNKANERLNVVSREFGDDCDLCGVSAVCSCRCEINKLINEVQNAEDKS